MLYLEDLYGITNYELLNLFYRLPTRGVYMTHFELLVRFRGNFSDFETILNVVELYMILYQNLMQNIILERKIQNGVF